jgi:hypothetical protein
VSVGAPACQYLEMFAQVVESAFGHGWGVYHVGSSVMSKQWRDVDVRLILDDAEFDALFGEGASERTHGFEMIPKWCALNMAFSALGERMTGLPIDFQIQPQTWANERHSHEAVKQRGEGHSVRSALTICGPLNRTKRPKRKRAKGA